MGKKIVFAVFKIPKKKKSNPSRQLFIQNSEASSFNHKGLRIAYFRWRGSGEKILLLHGWGSDSGRWKIFVPLLQEAGYDIHAIDAPAHGKSGGKFFTPKEYAEAISSYIDNNKIVILIGHSAGAYTTIYYSSNFTHQLNKLVALAPTFDLNDVIIGMKEMLKLNDQSISLLKEEFQNVYGAPIENFRADVLAKNISTDALLIHDEDDDILPVNGSKILASTWDTVEYIQTSKLGHGLNNKKLYMRIINFLKSS